MAGEGERLRHARAPRRGPAGRALARSEPQSDGDAVEPLPVDRCGLHRREALRRGVDRGAAVRPRTDAPPHDHRRRGRLGRARARALHIARVDRADAALPCVLSRARGDAGRAAGASRRRAAGARLEPASMKTLIAAILSVPAIVAASAAVSFYKSNRPNGTLILAGETRKYELYVPRSYDRAKPAPLVISMHGAGGWPVQQMNLSRWNRVADREGFLVVYPSGLGGRGPRVWRDGRDVRFISELIDTIAPSYTVDRDRIYANGFSNGGGMAFVLSCMLSGRLAAVGMVGAAPTLPGGWCSARRAVPMIAFHGTDDRMALYDA